MNLSVKMRSAFILLLVFLLTFFVVMVIISSTQSAYSSPEDYVTEIEDMSITIGPKPNATNVPLDTTITIDALSSATLGELNITPDGSISSIATEVSGPLSYKQTFYPANLLKPSTCYTISITINNAPFSWSFTTTSELFQPKISHHLVAYAIWIALAVATIITVLATLAVLKREESMNKINSS